MNITSKNAITQLEQTLIQVLKDEYSFYQSLYILLDKQRDIIRFDKDENLLDIYSETERCQRRIKQSEAKVNAIKKRDPRLFKLAAVCPEVRKLINSIATLVRKNIKVVEDNREFVDSRHERIKAEMDELKNSDKILQYLSDIETKPQFVDGKK